MVVALVADLIFQSKITGVADHLGLEVRIERTIAAARAAAVGATGVLVDLSADENGAIDLIQGLRQSDRAVRIIGFFPHVQAELARRARAAGADQVLTRSKFTESLPNILRTLSEPNPAPHWPDSAHPL